MKNSPKSFRIFTLTIVILSVIGFLAVRFHSAGTAPRKVAEGANAGQTELHKPEIETPRESEPMAAREKAARGSSTIAPVSFQPETNLLFPTQLNGAGDLLAQNQQPERKFETEDEEEAKPDQPDEALKWRMLQLVDEDGSIPHNALINAREHAKRMPFDPVAWPIEQQDESVGSETIDVAGIQRTGWTWLGPGNIGGRIRSILIHPTNAQVMWVGSVSGGIWKTTNGGANWFPLDDFMANLAVTSLVMHPTDPNVIYAGTGEGFFNGDSLRGAGIFKTTNGGTTWTQLASTSNSDWYYVNRLAINPANGQIILAATNSGIWRSTDGGASWSIRSFTRALDIDFNPLNGNECIASGDPGARYSTDGGQTWNTSSGLPFDGRVEVAYARSNPLVVYASSENNKGELFLSTNGGQTYTLVNSGLNYLSGQGWYSNALWVDPTNFNNVVVGGLDLWRSSNGGVSLTKISQWQSAPNSAHADHHVIVESPQFGQLGNRTVFFGNDGGIYKTTDYLSVGLTTGWIELNNNLGITQFYGGAGNPTSGRILGGTQDNGTLRYTGNTETWNTPFGGDGGWCAADPTNQNYFYGEYVYLKIHRSTDGGFSSGYIYAGLSDAESDRANFIAPFILDPNNADTLLAGGDQLWRSTNVKALTPTWSSIKSTVFSNISAIAVAKGNSNIIWVGHNDGSVYYTTSGTSASPIWTRADTNSPGLPNRYCTRITIDPTNSNRVYVTFGGFSSGNVWRSDNGGGSWTNITSNLPSAPVRSLAVWQQNTNYLYVGTEVGIFASADGGQSWSPSNDGPTNCSVDELFWMGNTLVAATHGRGMFSINVGGVQTNYTISVSASPAVGGTVSGGGTFAAGTSHTVTATANANYTFANWTENGSIVSSSASYTFTLNNNRILVANFTTGGGGGQATYDTLLKAPKCGQAGSVCDSGALLDGRDTLASGPEPHQPNTINNSCADGTSGTYHDDESIDKLKVSTLDGSNFAPGKTVKIEATVWAWSATSDFLDLYYAADATNPNWTFIATLQPSAKGMQVLSANYTLPTGGSLQAVRAHFRFSGVTASCGSGSFDDHDDLIFAASAPTTSVQVTVQSSPAGRTFTVDGTTYNAAHTFTWSTGSSHSLGTTSPQSGGVGVQYVWSSWSDAGAISHTVAPTTSRTYTASFVTVTAPAPTTTAATSITGSSATLNGVVNPKGAATNCWFEWGTSPTLVTFNQTPLQAIGAGGAGISVNRALSLLNSGTTYYYRVVGSNSLGTSRGAILSFTTTTVTGSTENVVWTNAAGVSISGNNLTKTATTVWGNAGASSTRAIASGNGYVEFKANSTDTYRMCGLSKSDSDWNFGDIDFALYVASGGKVYIYEKGVLKGTFGSYVAGDLFRVGVEGGVVRYRKNGVLLYSSTQAPSYPLLVDTSLQSTGATINNTVISGNLTTGSAVTLENVVWANAVGVSVSGNNLTKTAPTLWGNAGASSTQAIVFGNGYVEFTANATNTYRMCGLSKGDTDRNFADIDYALYASSGGKIYIYEKGALKGTFGAYLVGDVFRVGVESGVVRYRKNGILLYSSSQAPAYPLLVDTSLYSLGATINNVRIQGSLFH